VSLRTALLRRRSAGTRPASCRRAFRPRARPRWFRYAYVGGALASIET
jgi:hypothetical protein